MKFLAMLRDSWRETLDSKLFYVLIGLSTFVILLVACVSYRPVDMKTQVDSLLGLRNLGAAFQEHRTYRVEDFEQLDPGAQPWAADYRFTFIASSVEPPATPRPPAEKGGEGLEIRVQGAPEAPAIKELTPATVRLTVEQSIPVFQHVDVREIAATVPGERRFQVTTHGTVIESRQEWFHQPVVFFGLFPMPVTWFTLQQYVRFFGEYVVATWGAAFTMLVSTIITAFFIPNMLARGTLDLLLVKPLGRTRLFLYKFVGGLLFMFVNTVVIMVGIWLSLGLQSGLWANTFLLCILVFTLQFAMLYSVSALAAVLTRSAIVAILATLMFWGFLFAEGWGHWWAVEQFRAQQPPSEPQGAYLAYDVFHKAMPRYKELDWLTSRTIKAELLRPVDAAPPIAIVPSSQERRKDLDREFGLYSWTQSVAVSCAFVVAMLGLACWRFATRDY